MMDENLNMNNIGIPSEVTSLFEQFEAPDAIYREESISSAIRKYVADNRQLSNKVMFALKAEHAAFNFISRYIHTPEAMDKYFEPIAVDINGRIIEHPSSMPEITPDMTKYWQKRCDLARHPILRARYADLIWLYGAYESVGKRIRVHYARVAVDSYLDRFEKTQYNNFFEAAGILKRALYIALKLNDKNRVLSARDAFFRLFEREVDVSKSGTWGILYDNIYGQKNIPLTRRQTTTVIDSLEDFLYQTTDQRVKAKFSPWAAEAAAKRLIRYYHSQERKKDVRRVVKRYGLAYENIAQEADSLLAMAWLQPVFELYRKEGLHSDAKRVHLMLKAKGKDADKSMKKVETEVTLDQKEIDHYLSAMSKGGLYASLVRLVFEFTPKIKEAEEALKELGRESPLLLKTSRVTVSDNQFTAKVGSIDHDLEGHLIVQIAEHISLTAWLLGSVIEKLKRKYKLTPQKLIKFVNQSPIFGDLNMHLLEKAITYYLKNDHIGAIHVIVPQIEHAFRCLLAALGEPTSKCVQPGIMQEKNLNDIFAETKIKDFFPRDLLVYYKTFLSDPRGFNLRNRVSHGLMKDKDFNQFYADRSIHILLSLALIRPKKEKV